LNATFAGWSGLHTSLAGLGLAFAILIGPFAAGGIGAGDVKMMAAVGALLGPRLVLFSLVLGSPSAASSPWCISPGSPGFVRNSEPSDR
jgi:Flp pilus assembly protein protease CpaA